MTPKEKAVELLNKYTIATWIKIDEIKHLTTIPTAKECALIAVDEILSFIEDDRIGFNWKDYYKEVKQEINNL